RIPSVRRILLRPLDSSGRDLADRPPFRAARLVRASGSRRRPGPLDGGGRMRIARCALVISLVLPALLLIPNHVVAFCEILEPPSSFPTQVNGTQVEIRLTEGFARVVIIKEFYNPSSEPKRGQIFFPLEKGHELITDLRLKIGNVVYNSSAGDRGGALDDFLTAIAQGQDAALVQYDPPRDVYWIAVTIPPKETRTTITTLEMPLAKRDGSYDYHYRLSVDARDSVAYLRVHLRVETATPLVHVHLLSHPDVPVLRIGDRAAEAYINDTGTVQGRDLDVHFGAASSALAQWVDPQGERYVRYSIDAWDPAWRNFMAPMPRSLLVAVDASGSMGLDDRRLAADGDGAPPAADLRPDLRRPAFPRSRGPRVGEGLLGGRVRPDDADLRAGDEARHACGRVAPPQPVALPKRRPVHAPRRQHRGPGRFAARLDPGPDARGRPVRPPEGLRCGVREREPADRRPGARGDRAREALRRSGRSDRRAAVMDRCRCRAG